MKCKYGLLTTLKIKKHSFFPWISEPESRRHSGICCRGNAAAAGRRSAMKPRGETEREAAGKVRHAKEVSRGQVEIRGESLSDQADVRSEDEERNFGG